MIRNLTIFWILTVVCWSPAMGGENHWPRFRGPNAAGVAPDHPGLPITWTTTKNVKWVADVPGLGWSCPVVWGDRVFLTSVASEQAMQVPGKGLYLGEGVREPAQGMHRWMVYCFDLNTGGVLWKHEAHAGRPQVPRHPKSTYASETPTTDGQRLHVLFGDLGLWCYDLEGKLLWEFDGRMGKLVIPSPFTAHGLCYLSSGFVAENHRPTFALRPGASGNIAPDGDFANSEYIAWHQARSGSYNPSQIVYGDYLYTLYDRGLLTCHDARSGKEVYGKTKLPPGSSFTASPFAFNGRLFCLSEDGLTHVVKPGPEFEILASNPLDERCLASPAIAGDKLLIRTASKLYCLTEGPKLDAGRKEEASK